MIIGIGLWTRACVCIEMFLYSLFTYLNSFTQLGTRKDAMRFKSSTTSYEWQASRESYVQLVGTDLSVEIKISLKRSSYLHQLKYSSDYLGWMNKKLMNLLLSYFCQQALEMEKGHKTYKQKKKEHDDPYREWHL